MFPQTPLWTVIVTQDNICERQVVVAQDKSLSGYRQGITLTPPAHPVPCELTGRWEAQCKQIPLSKSVSQCCHLFWSPLTIHHSHTQVSQVDSYCAVAKSQIITCPVPLVCVQYIWNLCDCYGYMQLWKSMSVKDLTLFFTLWVLNVSESLLLFISLAGLDRFEASLSLLLRQWLEVWRTGVLQSDFLVQMLKIPSIRLSWFNPNVMFTLVHEAQIDIPNGHSYWGTFYRARNLSNKKRWRITLAMGQLHTGLSQIMKSIFSPWHAHHCYLWPTFTSKWLQEHTIHTQ